MIMVPDRRNKIKYIKKSKMETKKKTHKQSENNIEILNKKKKRKIVCESVIRNHVK